jgi:hypothetical protein
MKFWNLSKAVGSEEGVTSNGTLRKQPIIIEVMYIKSYCTWRDGSCLPGVISVMSLFCVHLVIEYTSSSSSFWD